jgi:hypothetical protein
MNAFYSIFALSFLFSLTTANTPIVIWHGMGELSRLKKHIIEKYKTKNVKLLKRRLVL